MLLIFGLGYTGAAMARDAAAVGSRVAITTRDAAARPLDGVEVVAFDAAGGLVAEATHIVSTVPPDASSQSDPVLAAYAGAMRASPALRWVGYLSTTGVYGDRAGGWVDEATPPAPGQPRSRLRRATELAWEALGDRLAVDLFRVAGIYGPGRSALDDLRAGRARRVRKPGHMFGRIHRDDIAGAVLAAVGQSRPPGVRVLNLSDDEPAEAAAVTEYAAGLLGVTPPEPVPLDTARLSEMARSFWSENRRVSSAATQAMLARRWRYPTYREGLGAILAEQAGQHPPE